MATVAAGASASETFSATANTVQITLDAGERAHVTVLSSAGALLYRNNLQNSQTIGPFAVGAVMSITAIGGSIDYTVVDGDEYFTRPVGITPSGASVAPDGSSVSGDATLKAPYRSGSTLGTVIADGSAGISGAAGSWAILGGSGTLSIVADTARPGRSIVRLTGVTGAGTVKVGKKITSTSLTGKITWHIKANKPSAGAIRCYLKFSAAAPAADPPTASAANLRIMDHADYEFPVGIWAPVSDHPSSNSYNTGNANGRAWGSVETLPSVIQYVEMEYQYDASVPDAEKYVDIDFIEVNAFQKPMVCIGFDGAGAYPNINSFALPLFQAAGVKGYMSGSAATMQTNAARCNELYAAGWDLPTQALRSTSNYANTPKDFYNDLVAAKAIMVANGWTRPYMDRVITYPSNSRSATTDSIAASVGIQLAGATGGLYCTSKLPSLGLLGVGRLSLNGVTAAQAQAALDSAILGGSHLMYFGHDLVASITDSTTQMLQSEFATFFAYAVAKHNAGLIELVTPTEMLKRLAFV